MFLAITLSGLVLGVLIAGAILTALTYFILKKKDSVLLSFLQNSAGALFIFSGAVKAVDPLGTAFKMEQYFAEFEVTFQETWMSFIAPIFPFFAEYSAAFSVFMIVLEIVLGVMLILGYKRRLTAWLFLLIIIFFAILTGFTYLTGYVPRDANFFSFGDWVDYTKSNMRVTDCGCFGDFLKLDPGVSFMKDIVLLIPAIIFVIWHKKKHSLFTQAIKGGITIVIGLFTLWYCLSNYVWDIPGVDFRPFNEGVNILETREREEDAMANVSIIGWAMQKESTGQVVEVMNPSYSAVIKQYPKDKGWSLMDQIKSEPLIKSTKISEFEVVDKQGVTMNESLLTNEKATFWIINYKLPYSESKATRTVMDTIVSINPVDSTETMRYEPRAEDYYTYTWSDKFSNAFKELLNPLARRAAGDGIQTISIIKESSEDVMNSMETLTEGQMTIYKADDILLKTIIRSNPGLVVVKNGTVLAKYHINQLPDYDQLKSRHGL